MTALVYWSKPVLQCIVSKEKMEPAYLISIRGGGGGVSCMYLTTCHGEANARRSQKIPFCILSIEKWCPYSNLNSKSLCHLQCSINEIDSPIRCVGLKHFS